MARPTIDEGTNSRLFVADFRRPHLDTADTQVASEKLTFNLDRELTSGMLLMEVWVLASTAPEVPSG